MKNNSHIFAIPYNTGMTLPDSDIYNGKLYVRRVNILDKLSTIIKFQTKIDLDINIFT